MAITYHAQDKYAFLFSGPTDPRSIKDLENVFGVLTGYYNYPTANIKVVLGSTTAVPSIPALVITNVANVNDLETAFTAFADDMKGPAAGGGWKNALIYLTGYGLQNPARLVIDGGTTTVESDWLRDRLDVINDKTNGGCHVNVVAQQEAAGGFETALTGSKLSQWSFTYAGTSKKPPGDFQGRFFTQEWVRGLQLEPLPQDATDSGSYADQLGAAGEATNLLISMAEAEEYARQSLAAKGFTGSGYGYLGGPHYLGLPAFLIRDSPPPAWWESEDIVLLHPNHYLPSGDLWIPDQAGATPDFNNTIQITVRNQGTHPVREYALGIELFRTGVGVTNEQKKFCNQVPAGGVLLPIDPTGDTVEWNTPFEAGLTHECIRAEAQLTCDDLTFAWSPDTLDHQAQRNTDEVAVTPPTSQSLPVPGIQGFKKHSFGFRNPFETRRQFLLPMPELLQELDGQLQLELFSARAGEAEDLPLEIVPEPFPHVSFALEADEARELLIQVNVAPDFAAEDGVRLPFEILVAGDWGEEVRAPAAAVEQPGFAPLAGFTIVVKKGAATVRGTVADREHRPVPQARVFLRTADDLQGATLLAGASGEFAARDVNPDVYFVRAQAGDWRSAETMVVLTSGREEVVRLDLTRPDTGKRVEVILDRIRILNDKDPCLKGKGEIKFAAEVVPDNDPSRRQATRLPARGSYKVSQKAGKNDLDLGVTLFDGLVKNHSLKIAISGKEGDLFDPDDQLSRYFRELSGDCDSWAGQYRPNDEYLDREDVDEWALWYRIVVS